MKKNKLIRYILCLMLFFAVSSGQSQVYSQAQTQVNTYTSTNASAGIDTPIVNIQSEAAILIDGDTGQVLLGKNMHKKMYPASITKIMTAILALENGHLDDIITMSYDAVYSVGRDTSNIALNDGEMLTLEDALYAAALQSANDDCNGIAELIGGNMKTFAEMMTAKAKELGALNTHFNNAHGLPDPNHYSTPYDMARITTAAIKIPEFVKLFSTMDYDMLPTNKQPDMRPFHRTNSMFKEPNFYDGILIEKTGWTTDAGHTYVIAARRNGRTLVAVTMKSPNTDAKFADVTAMLDYGFNELVSVNYKPDEFAKEHYIFEDSSGSKADMNLIPTEDFNCLISKSLSKNDIDITYMFPGNTGAKAIFSLKPGTQSLMYSGLGEVSLEIFFNDFSIDNSKGNKKDIPAINNTSVTPETKDKGSVFSVIYKIISVILQILGFLFVILIVLYIRRYMEIQKKKREKIMNKNININTINQRRQ